MKVKISNKPGFFIIDDEDAHHMQDLTWGIGTVGYIWARSKKADGCKLTLLHRRIMGAGKGQIVDHIDGDKLNNSRSNLRFCTKSQNAANSKKSGTMAPYKGIYRHKYGWCAKIKADGKGMYLGFRKCPKEAALLYDAAARLYFGEFAKTNFAE
jgi:hypothetical protein